MDTPDETEVRLAALSEHLISIFEDNKDLISRLSEQFPQWVMAEAGEEAPYGLMLLIAVYSLVYLEWNWRNQDEQIMDLDWLTETVYRAARSQVLGGKSDFATGLTPPATKVH